jgi:thioredoxin 1
MVAEISSANFDSEVVKSNVPVLVDFWAPWCGPCRMVSPVVEAISKDFEGKLKAVKVNTDENTEIAGQFGITGIPTLIFFKGGQEVDRVVGFLPKERLTDKVNAVLA